MSAKPSPHLDRVRDLHAAGIPAAIIEERIGIKPPAVRKMIKRIAEAA